MMSGNEVSEAIEKMRRFELQVRIAAEEVHGAVLLPKSESEWEASAVEMIKRCEPTHPKTITKQMFVDAIDAVFISRAMHVTEGHREDADDLKALLKPRYTTVFDVLTIGLTEISGSHGPHSFKFSLLSHLFGLKAEDANQSDSIVECFIKVIRDINSQERNDCLYKIIARMKTVTPAEFLTICKTARVAKEHFNEKTSKFVTGLMEAVSLGYLTGIYTKGKEFKGSIRGKNLNDIEESVGNGTLSVFDAFIACLTSNIGQSGHHSFKHLLIKAIYDTFDLEKKLFVVGTEKESQYLARILDIESRLNVSSFLVPFIADLTQLMKASQEKDLQENKEKKDKDLVGIVKRCITQCKTEIGMKNKLTYVLEVARKEKTDEQEQAGSVLLEMFKTFKTPRTMVRNAMLDALLIKLKSQTVELTALDALQDLLTSPIGQEGPHSFKYKLLKKLFDELNDDVMAFASKEIIDCFIHVISEVKKDVHEEKELKFIKQ